MKVIVLFTILPKQTCFEAVPLRTPCLAGVGAPAILRDDPAMLPRYSAVLARRSRDTPRWSRDAPAILTGGLPCQVSALWRRTVGFWWPRTKVNVSDVDCFKFMEFNEFDVSLSRAVTESTRNVKKQSSWDSFSRDVTEQNRQWWKPIENDSIHRILTVCDRNSTKPTRNDRIDVDSTTIAPNLAQLNRNRPDRSNSRQIVRDLAQTDRKSSKPIDIYRIVVKSTVSSPMMPKSKSTDIDGIDIKSFKFVSAPILTDIDGSRSKNNWIDVNPNAHAPNFEKLWTVTETHRIVVNSVVSSSNWTDWSRSIKMDQLGRTVLFCLGEVLTKSKDFAAHIQPLPRHRA